MDAGRPAIDAEFVLDAQNLCVTGVEKIRRMTVGIQILLVQFEAYAGAVGVTFLAIIHRTDETI